MMGTNKKRYRELEAVHNEELEAVFIYGENSRTDRQELVSWYQTKKGGRGREDLYLLKSVLNARQIKWISKVYNGFDKKGADFFNKVRKHSVKIFEVK